MGHINVTLALPTERCAGASSHKFPTYPPGGATLFDFDVVHNGSKLRTGGDCRNIYTVED